jgi:TRAP-type C4-dicarboxylate transport system permease small subunit
MAAGRGDRNAAMTGGATGGWPPAPIGRALYRLSAGLAVLGGLVLAALVVMTCVSIAGRALLSAPIPGDFELVEIGCAVAVFAFLPYCQITRGNVLVDFFTARAGPRRRAALDAFGNLLFTVIAGLITWRAVFGARDLYRYNETTMVLAVPVWWGFVPAVFCAAVLTLVAAYTVWRSAWEARHGRPLDDGIGPWDGLAGDQGGDAP